MPGDDKTEYSVGPEKADYVDECKEQVDIFRGYPIPESAGVVIDFSKIKPVFIDRETLEGVLRDQEAAIVIPLGKGNEAGNTVYYASSTISGNGSTDYDDEEARSLIAERSTVSPGCECSNARDLEIDMKCDCINIDGESRCQCSYQGNIIQINVCG